MARGKLFEYAVLYHEPNKDLNAPVGDIKSSKMIVDPTRVLASSEKQVAMMAAKAVPADYDDELDDVEILIRPF